MENRKIISIVVVVVIIVVGGWFFLNLTKPTMPSPVSPNSQQNSQAKPEASKMPAFVMGTVTKIDGQTITVTSGKDTDTIQTSAKTVVISQVKDGTSYKNVDAKFSDIKVKNQIVIYYTQNSGTTYTADKIQILPF